MTIASITPAMGSIPLNTHLGLLPMGGHLHQTSGLMKQPSPFHGVLPPQELTSPIMGKLDSVSGPEAFRNVMLNTVSHINTVTHKPDALMRTAMAGGPVDIQDIVMANTKAELTVSLATQVMTKVIQAYEKLSQIQA